MDALQRLIQALSPETSLPQGWDSTLPKYCNVLLEGDFEFVAVQCHNGKHYVVSLVSRNEESVRSVLLSDYSSESIQRAVALLHAPEATASRSEAVPGQEERAGPSIARTLPRRSEPEAQRSGRDPNAPPSFEDEHGLTEPGRPHGPYIAFDPDRDLNPPGGLHPTLGPLGPNPLLQDPHSSGGIPGPGSGMHPSLRWEPRRGARYDPTSPFDPASPFGNSSNSPFDPPF